MKINQTEQVFQPVTITLETAEELENLKTAFEYAYAYGGARRAIEGFTQEFLQELRETTTC